MEYSVELKSFINIWLTAISSICYCYFIPAHISHSIPKLLSLLPVITLFLIIPLPISTVHLALPTFFYLVWLANFKLILFAFNRGPLSSKPRLPILTFIFVALLPFNPKQSDKTKILLASNPFPISLIPKPILLACKAAIVTIIIHVYQHKDTLHWTVITFLYIAHMYIAFELSLAITAYCVKIILGFDFETEPQYNEPYVATSLQDFWGRRWNLVSSSILRASVYNPIRTISKPALGTFWSQQVAIVVTFVVSGLMHELMFFYMMRVKPTWEVTWFFVLHGVCMAAEVSVKKAVKGRFRLHGVVSWMLTIGFLLVTCAWLFFAQPLRNGVDANVIHESSVLLKLLGLNGSAM